MSPDTLWVSISAYARIYGIDRSTVYKWLDSGLLTTYRVGKCIRVKHQPPLAARSGPIYPEQRV